MSSSLKSTVMSLASDVKSASLKDREKAVEELAHLLNPRNRSTNLADLGDKGYHEIFESIFSFVLKEKPSLYDKRKAKTTTNAAASRLSKCAAAVRMAVGRGGSKLGRKTLLALVDHITQVLPGPNSDFVQPLLQDYVKALAELLSHQAHVELLARKAGQAWEACVEFFLDLVIHVIPDEGEVASQALSSRASPAPGTSLSRSTPRSGSYTLNQKRPSHSEGGPLRDALEGLYHLVSGANAPVLRHQKDIIDIVLRVLRIKHLSLGSIQTLSFGISNAVFIAIQNEDIENSCSFVADLVPMLAYWWRSEKVSQDELIRALRNEISRAMFLMHLHLRYLISNSSENSAFQDQLEYLAEPLWLEYSKRSEAFRLQLADISFSVSDLPELCLQNNLFGLYPHNVEGESYWAIVQNLANLESILLTCHSHRPSDLDTNGEQPRKKRRTQEHLSRLRLKLKSREVGTRNTALQLIPFILETDSLGTDEIGDILTDLSTLIAEKDTTTASWALIACASCAGRPDVYKDFENTWRQIWNIAARSVSLPATSRAACGLLYSILDADFLPYHAISEELNNIVTAADVNGPAVLSDTSLMLMLHLFHVRNIRMPNAIQATCSHITRWAFLKWNPSESAFASFQSKHVQALGFTNLLRACCGLQPLSRIGSHTATSGGALSETWNSQRDTRRLTRYLLSLDNQSTDASHTSTRLITGNVAPLPDAGSFYISKKLILELLYPKLESLSDLNMSWSKKSSEGGTQISLERYQSLLVAIVIGALLIPQINDLNSTQSTTVESFIKSLAEKSLATAIASVDPVPFVDLTWRTLRPYIPNISTANLRLVRKDNLALLCIFSRVLTLLEEKDGSHDFYYDEDFMDIDQEFDSQNSRSSFGQNLTPMPRHNVQLYLSPKAFYTETKLRLNLLRIIYNDEGQIGLVPDGFIEALLGLSDEDLLYCQKLLIEIFNSDLITSSAAALKIIERLGSIMSSPGYQTCEITLTTCIEVIDGLHAIWLQNPGPLSESVGDFYNHFIRVCLPSNSFSAASQISMARFLLTLMRVQPEYGNNLGVDSCRTSLLYLLNTGPISVKHYIGDNIAAVFDLYILKLHDEVFVDVLDSLPHDPENVAGIAFRLLVLSNLACRWPTLLRRCTYHIFETPGKISHAMGYATRCVQNVSKALNLSSSKELFGLFSRQLLYTWLEGDSLDDIPFSIFGFANLAELLRSCQAEAVGLITMRGQAGMGADLAKIIGTSESELIKKNFSTAMAYSMIYGDAFGGEDRGRGERHIEKKLGTKVVIEARHENLVDMTASFFDLIDQDNMIEKLLLKHRDLVYAGKIMGTIKGISHSTTELPPNRQPMFKARFLINEIQQLCDETGFDFRHLWTPSLVVSIARKLFSTVHPALGSLHSCSVVRKIRILVCLAGPVAIQSYPLEMLLNSMRTFIVDPESADDALGVCQYLLVEGSQYLCQVPRFLAGFALSTLASLRVFLESSQASTTQESQFKETMGKAQKFHGWFTRYLSEYDSQFFKSTSQRDSFKSIVESAACIRSSGNAERGTSEGKLLLHILQDGSSDDRLLDESSRQLALSLLCSDFSMPIRSLDDVIEGDVNAVKYATEVWKSCSEHRISDSYLAWAGRVIGRAFSASGEIPSGVVRETLLEKYQHISPDSNGSEMALLSLLQDLTSSPDSKTSGLAEAALRKTVTLAIAQADEPLTVACQQTLTESLFLSSQWDKYRLPPSEAEDMIARHDSSTIWTEDISSSTWLRQLSVHLTHSVSESIILAALPTILYNVKGFAEKAFPFIVHLVLFFQMDHQQTVKASLSRASKQWLKSTAPEAKDNVTLLLNCFLYLRTQEYPNETSIADRSHWLDINYSLASAAALHCGMFKTALLFIELVAPESTRSSRRASVAPQNDINDTLLSIFENIDDPDAYYGLPEDSSLSTVLARVEYENEGMKTLAFRGARYDSHLRQRHAASEADSHALVKALNTLGLSGLSHSLLQTQQTMGVTSSSLENTFGTAQRLEMWNLPAPSDSGNHAAVVYKAFQSLHQATELAHVHTTIHDGFRLSTKDLTTQSFNATGLRKRLGALAILADLDDLANVRDQTEVENILAIYKTREQWMKSGSYDDVSQILSCRGTAMSMLSQHAGLLKSSKTNVGTWRQSQVKSLLMSAGIYRYYRATQESINISTVLMDLIPQCEEQGLKLDAVIKVETATSLWDHGEMSTSIRMLQRIENESLLKDQSIPISRSDLLSRIGHQVSVARLEKPQDIQKRYLEPALKELKGNAKGKEAGSVYHQFALFCDGQLQDPAGLEDLERLQNLKKGKSDEVAELQSLISTTRDSQLRTRYNHVLSREKQWLSLDEQELRRVEQTRAEFVRLSMENYLLSLIASDEYNNDALRFIALWLERSAEEATNRAVKHHLHRVPTRKFATLMNQLTSRLQSQDSLFQKLLMDLVYSICVDHPYHGMYQIWSGTKVKPQKKDEVAVNRVEATNKVAEKLAATKAVASVWLAIDKTSKYYHILAMEKNASKYKSGVKVAIKDSSAATNLVGYLNKYRIPPPTMDIELSVMKDYSQVPTVAKLEPTMSIASGVSAPKIITAVGTNGVKYKQLVKGGHDDLRQDAIMEQVFAAVSSLLKLHRSTQQRSLGIRTYKVLPLTASSGLIEFVPNTMPLHEFLMPAHERYYPKDLKGSQCRKMIFDAQNKTTEHRIAEYRKVTNRFQPVMRYFFMEYFADPDEWFARRLAYTRSTAAISMLGHVLGLGDRHGHNILLDTATGEAVHIDLGVAFEAGRILPVPELVPFRLTRDIVDGMGITKTEGVFRRCCEFTLDALREEQYSIMTILDVLRYDPLYTWSISPLRLAKLQKARSNDEIAVEDTVQNERESKGGRKNLNEPSEADRALEVVRKKLSKTLSVTATVNDLINQAMDEANLAVLYSGWAAYA